MNNLRPATLTNRSGTIAAGGTAQQLMPANTARRGFKLQNLSAGDLWIREDGSAATAAAPSIKLVSGGYYEPPPSGVTDAAVSVIGATTGQAFSAWEW